MTDLWSRVRDFFTLDTLSPHGFCLLWRPELLWTHATADVLIGLAYFSIPAALGMFFYHRRDVRFGWVILLFVAFILLCGLTHFMSVLTLWEPAYGWEALLKVVTAVASVITAVALWPLLPQVIAVPSPAMLHARIAERDQAVEELRAAMATMVEMREHERSQKLLLDELNHRVKNTLASVQSIASQTVKRSTDLDAFSETFLQRLMSLSTTHDLLVKRQWESASFRELVRATLGHYGKPYACSGVDLKLHPNVAVTLGMALHELATNALKYGAWSGVGAVEIAVSIEGDFAQVAWTERDGPRVKARRPAGFGSRLLERGVAAELGGQVTLDYRPQGLVCIIQTPLSERVRPQATETEPA
jgi:two-component sensor histidine kinase